MNDAQYPVSKGLGIGVAFFTDQQCDFKQASPCPGNLRVLWGPFCIRKRQQWFTLVSSEKGVMLYTGVSYWYCQPYALISVSFFLPDFIFLIKESLFSVTPNQDLFIVQKTIKTVMGRDWPQAPLWPYLFTTCPQHLCCLKLFQIPQSQMLPPCQARAQAFPLLGFANAC